MKKLKTNDIVYYDERQFIVVGFHLKDGESYAHINPISNETLVVNLNDLEAEEKKPKNRLIGKKVFQQALQQGCQKGMHVKFDYLSLKVDDLPQYINDRVSLFLNSIQLKGELVEQDDLNIFLEDLGVKCGLIIGQKKENREQFDWEATIGRILKRLNKYNKSLLNKSGEENYV